jgi:uncharacterized protein Veg
MKRSPLTIETVRKKIDELVGRNICMNVCRGRKKVLKYHGVVENAFKNVFVVKLTDSVLAVNQLSYSYSDILCGDVSICEAE